MSARLISAGVLALSIVAIAAVLVQHGQLKTLREEENRISAQTSQPGQHLKTVPADETVQSARPSPELLELRSKVTQLTQRKQQMESIRSENEHLRSQLAARTDSAGQPVLPPGYIRKSQAQWVGLSTPEKTMQSFLWALQNHDLTHLSQTLDPKVAEQLMSDATNAPQHGIWEGASAIPGMRLVNQQRAPDGSIRAQMELIPGQPLDWFRFEQISGEWKIDF